MDLISISHAVFPLYDPLQPVKKAVSQSDDYCFGYQNSNTDGYYITSLKIACGKVNIKGLGKDEILEGIVAYDRAERNSAYIGQVNMITVSSFSGPMSAIWGYDMAKVDPSILYADKLFEISDTPRKTMIPVYSMDPLVEATEKLFGTGKKRKFPVIAGGHLPTAQKSCDSVDPATGKPTSGWVWSYLSLAMARRRGVDASLFVEDAGFFPDTFSYGEITSLSEEEVELRLKKKAHQVTYSQILCGQNQSVPFEKIFISWRKLYIKPGEYGTALTCAPYITLAKKVYPDGPDNPQALLDISLDDWEETVGGRAALQPTT